MSVYDRAAESLQSWDQDVYEHYIAALDDLVYRLDVLTQCDLLTTVGHFRNELNACERGHSILSTARHNALAFITTAKEVEEAENTLDTKHRSVLHDLHNGTELHACGTYINKLVDFRDHLDETIDNYDRVGDWIHDTLVSKVVGDRYMQDRFEEAVAVILPLNSFTGWWLGTGGGYDSDDESTDPLAQPGRPSQTTVRDPSRPERKVQGAAVPAEIDVQAAVAWVVESYQQATKEVQEFFEQLAAFKPTGISTEVAREIHAFKQTLRRVKDLFRQTARWRPPSVATAKGRLSQSVKDASERAEEELTVLCGVIIFSYGVNALINVIVPLALYLLVVAVYASIAFRPGSPCRLKLSQVLEGIRAVREIYKANTSGAAA